MKLPSGLVKTKVEPARREDRSALEPDSDPNQIVLRDWYDAVDWRLSEEERCLRSSDRRESVEDMVRKERTASVIDTISPPVEVIGDRISLGKTASFASVTIPSLVWSDPIKHN